MNKKHTSLKEFKLDECQVLETRMSDRQSKDAQSKATRKRLVDMDELKETFRGLVMETVEEYAKHIPEPKIVRPNVTIQCDGTACKSVQDDIGTINTDIGKIKGKTKSIDDSLKTISNDLGKRPCLKCVPKELSGFYFRGRHINAIYVFTMFASLLMLVVVECAAYCKQQTAAKEKLETAVRWNAIYLECNHKYEQLVKEVKDNLPKKCDKKDGHNQLHAFNDKTK